MKRILLSLTGITLCAVTFQSAPADPAVFLQTKHGEESHAVVTDIPDIIDMSHADPKPGIAYRPPLRSMTRF
jgi:hypothetical protein